jgi:serine phosphatase RsbU (regulator of sigma subunit)
MSDKPLSIAFTQIGLMKEFQARMPEAKCIQFKPEAVCENLGKADIFILDDKTALAVAEFCENSARPSLFVTANEGGELPESFARGYVDDLIALPLRALDVVRVVRFHEQLQSLRELESSSRAVPGMVKRLQEDIQLAQKIQRRLIKDKFPSMGGLSIKSKYWCGLKAGGDYFDVFEFPDQNHVGVILADSSSYALSTHFLGSLMQFSVHVGQGDLDDPAKIVRALHGKVREGMKDKDRFSLLYGILDRKTYKFRYVDCGAVFAAHKGAETKDFWLAKGDRAPLTKAVADLPAVREIGLEPGDRLFLFSDGWSEGLESPFLSTVERLSREHNDPQEFLNEMAFSLRKGVERHQDPEDKSEEFPMPPQDCSVLVLDVAKNVLRLAR